MSPPTPEPPRREPGEPARPIEPERAPVLDHPPSDRYVKPSDRADGAAAAAAAAAQSQPRMPRRPLVAALLVALVGAAGLTVILGVLLATAGTFVVSGLGGVSIGLLIASAAVPARVSSSVSRAGPTAGAGRIGSAPMSRHDARRLAVSIATGMIVLAGLGVWLVARAEGGVMDPLSYLWTTFGFGIPAQALVAVLAAAWGAANGPIRWRA